MDVALVHQRALLMQNMNRRIEEEINECRACAVIGDWIGATSHQLFANSILDALKKLEESRQEKGKQTILIFYLKCPRCFNEFPSKTMSSANPNILKAKTTVTFEETCPACNMNSVYHNDTVKWKDV